MSLHTVSERDRERGAETRARLERLGIKRIVTPVAVLLPVILPPLPTVCPPTCEVKKVAIAKSPAIVVRHEEPVIDDRIEFLLDSMEVVEGPIITDSVSLNRIIRTVVRYYKISVTELLSQRRAARITIPRHITVWLFRRLTTKSLTNMGVAMGGRDHSTMLHSIVRADDLRGRDPVIQSQINELLSALRPASQGAINAEDASGIRI